MEEERWPDFTPTTHALLRILQEDHAPQDSNNLQVGKAESSLLRVLPLLPENPHFDHIVSTSNDSSQILAHLSTLHGYMSSLTHLGEWRIDLTVPDISRLIAHHCAHLEEDRESIRVPLRVRALTPIEFKLGKLHRGLLLEGSYLSDWPDGEFGIGEGSPHHSNLGSCTTIRKPPEGNSVGISSVAYSSDRQQLISGPLYKTTQTWDAETRTALRKPPEGYSTGVSSVAYSSDRWYIISRGRYSSPGVSGYSYSPRSSTGSKCSIGSHLEADNTGLAGVILLQDDPVSLCSRVFASGPVCLSYFLHNCEGHRKDTSDIASSPDGRVHHSYSLQILCI